MSRLMRGNVVIGIIDELEAMPYTTPKTSNGISINNTGSVDVICEAGNVAITVPIGQSYDADLQEYNTIDVTQGDKYLIEVRGW